MSRPLIVAVALLVSALVACSSDGGGAAEEVETKSPSPTPAASTGVVRGSGDYTFTHGGAVGVVTVPTAVTDARVAEYDGYRQSAGAIDVTYVVSEIDNTGGSEVVTMYRVVVVTQDGRQVEIPPIGVRLETWRDTFASGSATNSKAYERGEVLLKALPPVQPGRQGRLINAAAQSVPSVAQVYVYPTGGVDRVEAVPMK
jgi:hypothetical protein